MLDFPSNPTTGQIYNNYVWNGTAWDGLGQANNVGTQIAALNTASPKTVANAAARDALYPTPVQGNSVFRNDTARFETYYNAVGNTPAGWTTTPESGLVAMKPTSVSVGSGSASINSSGVVTFTGATSVTLNGVFTSTYTNYLVKFDASASAAVGWNAYLTTSGTLYSGTQYYRVIQYNGGYLRQLTNMLGIDPGASVTYCWGDIQLFRPQLNDYTRANVTSGGLRSDNATVDLFTETTWVNVNNSFDGINFSPSAGNISGNLQVFGYKNS